MAKEKTVYVCSNCGQDSPKWVGKCPSCGMWNTYVEEVVRKEVVNKRPVSGIATAKAKPVTLHEIVADDEPRIDLGRFQKQCIEEGVWIRPFGKNAYIMPPYLAVTDSQLHRLCDALLRLVSKCRVNE